MHPLHDYIAKRIAEAVRERHVVLIHDEEDALASFFTETTGGMEATGQLLPIVLDRLPVRLFTVDRSLLQARAAVEPLTGGDEPSNVVVYLPGLAPVDKKDWLLMELEKLGKSYNPRTLREYARYVLRKQYDDAAIDGILRSAQLTYEDLTALCRGRDGADSLLRTVFDTSDGTSILALWLADAKWDVALEKKAGWDDLRNLARARLGLTLPDDADAGRLRSATARYVLANEFRNDLKEGAAVAGPAAPLLEGVAEVPGKDELKAVRALAQRPRDRSPDAYAGLADDVAGALRLSEDCVTGDVLGAVDTFRFQELAAAKAAFAMVAAGRFDEAKLLISARGESVWVGRDDTRKVIWQVCRLMIDVCVLARRVRQDVERRPGSGARDWVDRYSAAYETAWFRLDLAQRRLETLLPVVEDECASSEHSRQVGLGFSGGLASSGVDI